MENLLIVLYTMFEFGNVHWAVWVFTCWYIPIDIEHCYYSSFFYLFYYRNILNIWIVKFYNISVNASASHIKFISVFDRPVLCNNEIDYLPKIIEKKKKKKIQKPRECLVCWFHTPWNDKSEFEK